MSLLDQLLEASADVWAQYNEHPFVRGIEMGTLPREKFRHYILQDTLYLVDYAKVFAVGVAKSKSPETLRLFSAYIHQLTHKEMAIHRGYMQALNITQEELARTPVALDNLSYTSYMLREAYEGGELEVLTSILACAYSYEVIAKKIAARRPEALDDAFYGAWIRGYCAEPYHDENVALIGMLEKLAENIDADVRRHLIDIFVACSRYELAFWDMAWELRK